MNKVIYTIIIYSFLTGATLVPSDSSRLGLGRESNFIVGVLSLLQESNSTESESIDAELVKSNRKEQKNDNLSTSFINQMVKKGDKAIQDNGKAMKDNNFLKEFYDAVELEKAANVKLSNSALDPFKDCLCKQCTLDRKLLDDLR